MDDLVDYEAYARSFPQDDSLVTIPEGTTHNIGPLDQIRTRDPPSNPYRLSANRPAQPNNSHQPLPSTPAIANSTDVREPQHGGKKEADGLQTAHTAVQNPGPVHSHPAPNPNAMNPNVQTQNQIPPPSTSRPLNRNHPNAATIPGRTPGTNRCDTCISTTVAATTAPTATSTPSWRLDRVIGVGRGVEYDREAKGGGGEGCHE